MRIDADEPMIGFAIERFVGQPRARIVDVAKESLEGSLRTVIADSFLEGLQQHHAATELQVKEEAEHDLRKLGLVIDTLKLRLISVDSGPA